jgi:hypothetical protein
LRNKTENSSRDRRIPVNLLRHNLRLVARRKGLLQLLPSLRDKDVPLHGRGLQAPCVPTDRVRVNAARLREVIVQCGCGFESTRVSHTSKTLFFGWRLRPWCGTLLAK